MVFLRKYLICVMLLLGLLHGYKSCIEEERKALLELKKYIVSITKEEKSETVLPTWAYDTKSDCCRWEGVECNHTSRRVSEIAFGGLHLKENSLLNLSLLYPFEDVRSLNLSMSRFSNLNPLENGGVHIEETDNQFADLFNNRFAGLFDDVEGYKSLGRLRNLEILDLSGNEFNNRIFPFLSVATSLATLFLRNNYMDGIFPAKELGDLINLELLDLSMNRFSGTIPVKDISTLMKLKALDLSDNEFSGSIEWQGICNLKNMQELDLSRNKIVGMFPSCLTRLSGLRVLDLSSNQMTGKLPSTLSNLESLEYLSLFDNNFEGFFSLGSLATLSELRVLKLGSKSNSLQVESEGSWKPSFQLNAIVLRSCNLEEVPHFLLQQKDLRQVDLSGNKISGNFPSWLMENNKELLDLCLKNNYLTSFHLPKSTHGLLFLDVSMNNLSHLFPENIGYILPQLILMDISSNSFQGKLPSSLGNMKNLASLDLSCNSFQGKIPKGFLKDCYSMKLLKLSHNKLSGEIFPEEVPLFGIEELLMDNNQFTGKIGQGFQKLQDLLVLDISNNSLSGVIPSWIGELPALSLLLLSNNMFEGELPTSLFNKSNLWQLDLSGNMLSGNIHRQDNSTAPKVLLLKDNNLSGVIRDTLLQNVFVLDLRNNRFSGNIPKFSNTHYIHTLLLRGNNLTGGIPRQLCHLSNIHLLDLANNKLKGSIPSCHSNTSFGLREGDAVRYIDLAFSAKIGSFEFGYDLEQDSTSRKGVRRYFNPLLVLDPFYLPFLEKSTLIKFEFATKHRYDSYMGENRRLLFGMDLSENELTGEIPFWLGGLVKLQALNLSRNRFSGAIPDSFSGLKNVESLDLSFNRLQGRIPSQLAELSSLAVFNVSFNNLSGSVPQGRQFNTFDSQSFIGNPFLCGLPTNTNCAGNSIHPPDNVVKDKEGTIDMDSFYWSSAAAFVTILFGVFASLSFDSLWSRFWFYMVDAFIHKMRNFFC